MCQTRTWIASAVVVALLSVLTVGCRQATEKAKQYEVKATVVALDSNKPTVTLDHEAIPGLMQGMVMEFPVENGQLLKGIAVGDSVTGQLTVTPGGNKITRLEKR